MSHFLGDIWSVMMCNPLMSLHPVENRPRQHRCGWSQYTEGWTQHECFILQGGWILMGISLGEYYFHLFSHNWRAPFFFRRHFWNANALIFWWNPQIHHFSDFIGIVFFGLIHTLLFPSERSTLSFGLHVVWGWFSRRSRTALPITRSTFSNEGILHHPVRYCPHGRDDGYNIVISQDFPMISQ